MLRITFAAAVACLLLASVTAAQPIGGDEIQVTDGDTIFTQDKVYRLVGFNTPETFKARCAEERALGIKAHKRLQALINAGGLELMNERTRGAYTQRSRMIDDLPPFSAP